MNRLKKLEGLTALIAVLLVVQTIVFSFSVLKINALIWKVSSTSLNDTTTTVSNSKVNDEVKKINVSTDDDPAKGPKDAPVTIVEFSDFECHFCAEVQETLNKVLKKYGDSVRLVFRDFPMGDIHKYAYKAAIAAECAHEQDKFWPLHDRLFQEIEKGGSDSLEETRLIKYAGDIGLDVNRFKACIESDKYQDEVWKDYKDGLSYGVTGTPIFFINGKMIVGSISFEEFDRIIQQELKNAN